MMFDFTVDELQGGIVRVQGDEFWHMTKVLRLSADDRYYSSTRA